MIDTIKSLLKTKDINGYKIVETKTESIELFFIKKSLDMDRSKKVHYFSVTVYKDFQESGNKFKGSSTCNIYPTMNKEEIDKILSDAVLASNFVQNEFYTLPKPSNKKPNYLNSKFSLKPISYWIPELTKAIFKYDTYENGGINSCELFLSKCYIHIINSEGIDVSYEKYKGELEFIVNFIGSKEEVELYKFLEFSDFDTDYISENVKEMLILAKEKALANTTLKSSKYTILLSGSALKEFFSYYISKSNVANVYSNISQLKIGDNIQGESIDGDLINISLNPTMENSTHSVPYDMDGITLSKINLFENGILKQYHGSSRYSYYLNVEPTGSILNIDIKPGSKSLKELKKSPHVELISFSDFQLNPVTGDFGGEIRLGWYYDGEKTIPITGGSVSGNINNIHKHMYLSKETQQCNGFKAPKTVQMFNVSIAGL